MSKNLEQNTLPAESLMEKCLSTPIRHDQGKGDHNEQDYSELSFRFIVVDNKKRSQKTHKYWKGRNECLFADNMIAKESAEKLTRANKRLQECLIMNLK